MQLSVWSEKQPRHPRSICARSNLSFLQNLWKKNKNTGSLVLPHEKNSHPDMLIHQRNAEKVRTRYFLSKTIDGLENSTIDDNCLTTKTVGMMTHTSYLPFLLHCQDFWKPNFTPKKTTNGTKNTKNVSEKVKYMHFFSLNLEKFTPDRKFLHRHVCGVCDKYEVCITFTVAAPF